MMMKRKQLNRNENETELKFRVNFELRGFGNIWKYYSNLIDKRNFEIAYTVERGNVKKNFVHKKNIFSIDIIEKI